MADKHPSASGRGDLNIDASDPKTRCFFAYPSSAPDRVESIETAIDEINHGGLVDVFGWKKLVIGGRLVVSAICDEIKSCQIFIADVTGLNPPIVLYVGTPHV
jgi:hypothetical protein